jgi:hypothetical protein
MTKWRAYERATGKVFMFVPMSTGNGKVVKKLTEVGCLHATLRLGKASRSDVVEAVKREFFVTGRVVPPWRVQEIADEIHAKAFAEVLLDDEDRIPF